MLNDINDNQLKDIQAALSENKGEESELLKRILSENDGDEIQEKSYVGIPENTEDKPFPYNAIAKESIESKIYVQLDPKTGKEIEKKIDVDTKSLTEAVFDEKDVDINKGVDTLVSYGISDMEAVKLFDVISRFKSGEKFNIYTELPASMKVIVKKMNGSNMGNINSTAKELLNHFIRDMYVDKEFIDLQESLQKELNLSELSDMYNDDLKSNMEVELIKTADDLDAKGETDKALLLRKVSAAFTDSYLFTTIIKALNENELIKKKISRDLSRYKRFVNEFNYKYKDSQFKISNIKLLEQILPAILKNDNISKDDIKKFIIVICKVTQQMTPVNVDEHTFMYYTIQNILLLQHLDLQSSAFGIEVYNNLLNTINLMKEVDKDEYTRCKK